MDYVKDNNGEDVDTKNLPVSSVILLRCRGHRFHFGMTKLLSLLNLICKVLHCFIFLLMLIGISVMLLPISW